MIIQVTIHGAKSILTGVRHVTIGSLVTIFWTMSGSFQINNKDITLVSILEN